MLIAQQGQKCGFSIRIKHICCKDRKVMRQYQCCKDAYRLQKILPIVVLDRALF